MESGIYEGLDFKAYRARTDFVSVSELKAYKESPFTYKRRYLDGIKEESVSRPAQSLGTLCHCLLLEEDSFDKQFIVSDVRRDLKTKIYQAEVERAAGRGIINSQEFEKAKACVEETKKELGLGVLPGVQNEISLFYKGHHFALPVKARFDRLAMDGYIYDYKTTQSTVDNASAAHEIEKWSYHWQAAFYLDIFEAVKGERLKGFKWVFQQTVFPFACRVYDSHPDLIAIGRHEYRQEMAELAKSRLSGEYPKLKAQEPVVNLPQWRLSRYFGQALEAKL